MKINNYLWWSVKDELRILTDGKKKKLLHSLVVRQQITVYRLAVAVVGVRAGTSPTSLMLATSNVLGLIASCRALLSQAEQQPCQFVIFFFYCSSVFNKNWEFRLSFTKMASDLESWTVCIVITVIQ